MNFLHGGEGYVCSYLNTNYLFRYNYDDSEFTKVLNKLYDLFRTNFLLIYDVNSLSWLRYLGFLFSVVSFFFRTKRQLIFTKICLTSVTRAKLNDKMAFPD